MISAFICLKLDWVAERKNRFSVIANRRQRDRSPFFKKSCEYSSFWKLEFKNKMSRSQLILAPVSVDDQEVCEISLYNLEGIRRIKQTVVTSREWS